MLYMVQVRYPQEQRDAALAYFQEHGLTHYAGSLVLKGLWVSTSDRIAYALVAGTDTAEVANACQNLEQFGQVEYRLVISSDQL